MVFRDKKDYSQYQHETRPEATGKRARPCKAIGFGSRGHIPDGLVDNGKLEGQKCSDDTKHSMTLKSA